MAIILSYMNRFFQENKINIIITEEERKLLRDNTCDFVSFSYYSSAVATVEESSEQTAGNLVVSTKNPYLKASDWGWQIDPIGLRIMLNKMYDRTRSPYLFLKMVLGLMISLKKMALFMINIE